MDSEDDYSRTFSFFELIDLYDNSEFTYWLKNENVIAKGPFKFKSNVFNNTGGFNIKTFGDHDNVVGFPVTNFLEKTDYDLLIILGDVAINIDDENGRKGDRYFDEMENCFTKAPVILIPGNHERVDQARLFTTRFMFPGTKKPDDNNLFYFVIQNVMFTAFNNDFYFSKKKNQKKMHKKLQKIFKKEKKNKIDHKILLNHHPFLCSEYFL